MSGPYFNLYWTISAYVNYKVTISLWIKWNSPDIVIVTILLMHEAKLGCTRTFRYKSDR
jgi:hypothetical protein